MADELLSVRDAAAFTKMGEKHIRALIAYGEINLAPNIDKNVTADVPAIPRAELEQFERRRAFHEAGHVVAARKVGWDVHGVSIIPDEERGGAAPMSPPRDEEPEWPY